VGSRSTTRSDRHFFEDVADHAGAAYLRYSFTKGTEQEVRFLVDALELTESSFVLDVGCGPGRHAHALASRGIHTVGLDISERFARLAASGGGGSFVRGDALRLPFASDSFDVAYSLCQGGFGLLQADDADVLVEMARVVRPGGHVCVSAFSSYFAVRHLEEGDTFDADRGVNHEVATVKSEDGDDRDFDLWTTCFTPRELRLMAERAGLQVDWIASVAPGRYGRRPPGLDHPEWLMAATVARG
jgi:SAM-dependent methyltransferase